ncbi:hypothetical protein GMRT_10976 [Giardia muris]|uniref:RRM domain-containing protein n=1 Tax=Giardia muris TaxID=5742 RepID=A0A4Z1T840_GIAMU|nr:hypothetical protein GMRT_10976 [Giardia muris]|eukprot:TNJ29337.1 hypothetical protein GMRT_10976 [Giardia muris]
MWPEEVAAYVERGLSNVSEAPMETEFAEVPTDAEGLLTLLASYTTEPLVPVALEAFQKPEEPERLPARYQTEDDRTSVFISHIPRGREDDLREALRREVGGFREFSARRGTMTAVVSFFKEADVRRAIDLFHNRLFRGRCLTVVPKTTRQSQ